MVEITIDSGEVYKFFRQMPRKVQKKIVRGMIRRASKPIIKEAKSRVHSVSGNLKRSIGYVEQKPKNGVYQGKVLPRVGEINGRLYKGYHAHLVEYGHSVVVGGKKGKGGKVIGFVPPKPFLRPAFDNKKEEAIKVAIEYMKERLLKELFK